MKFEEALDVASDKVVADMKVIKSIVEGPASTADIIAMYVACKKMAQALKPIFERDIESMILANALDTVINFRAISINLSEKEAE